MFFKILLIFIIQVQFYDIFNACWYDSCHNIIEQNYFEWSWRQLSTTKTILEKNKQTFWPTQSIEV